MGGGSAYDLSQPDEGRGRRLPHRPQGRLGRLARGQHDRHRRRSRCLRRGRVPTGANGPEDIAEIRKLTPKPVRYLLNTHWHIDHNAGNSAYLEAFPELEIVAQSETRRIMNGKNPGVAANWAAADGPLAKEIASLKGQLASGKGRRRQAAGRGSPLRPARAHRRPGATVRQLQDVPLPAADARLRPRADDRPGTRDPGEEPGPSRHRRRRLRLPAAGQDPDHRAIFSCGRSPTPAAASRWPGSER